MEVKVCNNMKYTCKFRAMTTILTINDVNESYTFAHLLTFDVA